MKSMIIWGILVLTLSIGLSSCVGLETKTRRPAGEPRINEEDITDESRSAAMDRPARDRSGMDRSSREGYPGTTPWSREDDQSGQGQLPGPGSPSTGYSEQTPREAEEPPPPRRFKWRDRQGNERGWELKDRNGGTRE